MNEYGFIFILLALFGIKHFIADFLLQDSSMLKDKGVYGAKGGLDHAMMHGVGTFLLLVPFFVFLPDLRPVTVLMGLVDAVIHYHIDWAKYQLSAGLTPADRKFWVWFGLDQALHYLTYIGIIAFVCYIVYH
jgi:hypothetical protein